MKRDEKEWVQRIRGSRTLEIEENPKKDPMKKIGGFKEVAGMEEQKKLIIEGFINVLNNRECAEAYGIVPPSLLFYGPSGCGKTFFAENLAGELGVNFIKVVPDDIASTWVHGTQEKICEIFRKAEEEAPTILFFDEFDAMVPNRTDSDLHNQNGEVNEFLCKLNNASQKGVYIIAATNHPESIDRAVLRTGRIDEMIYIGMPEKEARESLFRLLLSKLPSDKDIDYGKLADLTQGYNCSDIKYIVQLASRRMFNASIAQKDQPYKAITQTQLEDAISNKTPSVTLNDLREYERIRSKFSPKDIGSKQRGIGYMIH